MRTDLHLYTLFRHCPQFIFELARLPWPGPCRMEQMTVKAISRTMDGLVTPADPAAPLSIVEFQFQNTDDIYTRIVIEMASVQQQHAHRPVQGIIFFLTRRFDPRTPPWTHSVRAVYLDAELRRLESENPEHPLVSVFKPILERSDAVLEKSAPAHYHRLQSCRLPAAHRAALLSIFTDWLYQRFKNRNLSFLKTMMTDFTGFEKSVLGREIMQLGVERGVQRGMQQSVQRQITAKFGKPAPALVKQLKALTVAQLNTLAVALLKMEKAADLRTWLARR